jgi:hypothetical protein
MGPHNRKALYGTDDDDRLLWPELWRPSPRELHVLRRSR